MNFQIRSLSDKNDSQFVSWRKKGEEAREYLEKENKEKNLVFRNQTLISELS